LNAVASEISEQDVAEDGVDPVRGDRAIRRQRGGLERRGTSSEPAVEILSERLGGRLDQSTTNVAATTLGEERGERLLGVLLASEAPAGDLTVRTGDAGSLGTSTGRRSRASARLA
jgi:hypothetical protein